MDTANPVIHYGAQTLIYIFESSRFIRSAAGLGKHPEARLKLRILLQPFEGIHE